MKKMIMALIVAPMLIGSAQADNKILTMSTTTSTLSSGLLDILLPRFKEETGIEVKVIAKGTGAAIRDGMDGNVDIVFVHAIEREEQFVAEGYGTKRYAVMHNDFILLGPPADPVSIRGMQDAAAALQKIAFSAAPFISRGDDSGTHTKEQDLWKMTDLKVVKQAQKIMKGGQMVEISTTVPGQSSAWYISIGQGMGKTLTYADEKQAYTLADRGTYIMYKYGKTPAIDLEILCEKDEDLANPYGIIPVSPQKHPHVKFDLAETFAAWITSVPGQKLINEYRLEGKQLFFPDGVDVAEL